MGRKAPDPDMPLIPSLTPAILSPHVTDSDNIDSTPDFHLRLHDRPSSSSSPPPPPPLLVDQKQLSAQPKSSPHPPPLSQKEGQTNATVGETTAETVSEMVSKASDPLTSAEMPASGNDGGDGPHESDGDGNGGGGDGDGSEQELEEGGGNVGALGEGYYEIEAVRKKRVRKGEVQYLIKWRGWPESANTWEPFDNVKGCEDIIEEFEASSATKSGRRGRSKRKSVTHSSSQKKRHIGEEKCAGVENKSNLTQGTSNHHQTFTGGEEVGVEKLASTNNSDEQTNAQTETGKDLKEITGVDIYGEMKTEKLELTGNMNVRMTSGRGTENINLTGNTDVHMDSTITTVTQEVGLQHVSNKLKESVEDKLQSLVVEKTCSSMPLSVKETNEVKGEAEERVESICHIEAEREILQNRSGTSEQHKLNLSFDGAIQDDLIKDVVGKTSSSPPGKLELDTGKTSGFDRCTGAKKRKQGFVRRVPPMPDPEDVEQMAKPREKEHFEETRPSRGHDPVSSDDRDDHKRDSNMHEANIPTSPLLKILKAVNYTNSYVDGKHDVTVQFKVSRADGREVLVDNKFMKENYPILLIEFYEKHLRYTSSSRI